MGCSQPTPTQVESPAIEKTSYKISKDHPLNFSLTQALAESDFTLLLAFLDDNSEIDDMFSYPRWAELPTRVNASAIAITNYHFKRGKVKFNEEKLLLYSRSIVVSLSTDDDSLQQHLVYLISKLIPLGFSKLLESFLDEGIFEPMVSSMWHSNYMLRFYLAKACALMYKHSLRAKENFIREFGIRKLVGQMNLSPLRGLEFRKRLEYLLLLIMDQEGKVIPNIALDVSNEMCRNTMYRIDIKKFSENDSETFDKFIEALLVPKSNNDS